MNVPAYSLNWHGPATLLLNDNSKRINDFFWASSILYKMFSEVHWEFSKADKRQNTQRLNVVDECTHQLPSPWWLSRSVGPRTASSSVSGQRSREHGKVHFQILKKTKCIHNNEGANDVFVDLPYILCKAHYWVWALKCPTDAGSPSESGTGDEGAGRRRGCQRGADLRRSPNESSRQLVLSHYVTVCWVMDRAFLTSRFSISLTSSLTWLRIFLQHSALCWIPFFSVGSSADGQINIEMKGLGEWGAFRAEFKQKQ